MEIYRFKIDFIQNIYAFPALVKMVSFLQNLHKFLKYIKAVTILDQYIF